MIAKSILRKPAGVFGLLLLTGAFGFVGCKSSSSGASACGDGPCGGEVGGQTLKDKFPRWAEAKELEGSVERGRDYFNNQMYGSFMTCASCHGMGEGDTLTSDADGQIRAGHSVWGSQHRDNIKMHDNVAALGGNICVISWMDGPDEAMTAQELADMDAFLKSGGAANHVTSKNLNYEQRSYTIPETLTGGDAERGGDLALKYCQTCHEIGDKDALTGDIGERLKPGVVPTGYLGKLAARIKDKNKQNNDWIPGFPDERMPQQDLLDLLAYFEKK